MKVHKHATSAHTHAHTVLGWAQTKHTTPWSALCLLLLSLETFTLGLGVCRNHTTHARNVRCALCPVHASVSRNTAGSCTRSRACRRHAKGGVWQLCLDSVHCSTPWGVCAPGLGADASRMSVARRTCVAVTRTSAMPLRCRAPHIDLFVVRRLDLTQSCFFLSTSQTTWVRHRHGGSSRNTRRRGDGAWFLAHRFD